MSERHTQAYHSPATPVYILRGHAVPVHALHIFHQNLRLLSGDANGWVVIWDLVTKRPVTVWKAHQGAVLEVKGFSAGVGVTLIYTHGRDHKLCVWKLRAEDEAFLDKTLPVDRAESPRETKSQPWLLHSLPVNALNFCAFAMAFVDTGESTSSTGAKDVRPDNGSDPPTRPSSQTSPPEDVSRPVQPATVLFAVPNALDSGGIDIFHLPSERRVSTIPSNSSTKTGMLMAVNLFLSSSGDLYVAASYEDGHVMVFVRRGPLSSTDFERTDVSSNPWKWEERYASRPHTQPVLSIDVSPTREYFFSSSADTLIVKHPIPGPAASGFTPTVNNIEDSPLKVVNTKHSGQQGLRIRSDGKVFATAGWDSRVRVYSAKTMKELAVLKWHKEGCYAVAFGEIEDSSSPTLASADMRLQGQTETDVRQLASNASDLSLAAIQQQRNRKVQQTHWLAAGSKDGKISLWDIY